MLKRLNRTTVGISTVRPIKVLQFGEGVFMRGFVDWTIDILNEKTDFNGNVQVIQPRGSEKAEAINKQDGLYHVILNGLLNGKPVEETRLITCIANAIGPSKDFKSFLKTAENADLKFILTNTTEAGIRFDEHDVSIKTLPNSFPGKLTLLLYHRFLFFNGDATKAPVIIPCELIENNGTTLRAIILQYINHWQLSSEFKNWVQSHIVFCNTLVDRIVPGTPKDNIQEIQNRLGFEDNLVVMAEPFMQWVIEGPEHVRQELCLDKVSLPIKFVRDITPYRTQKVRILNGVHTAMVPFAYLYGLRTVRESIENPVIGNFVRETIHREIIPTLDLPISELNQFAADVLERFQNPYVKHELSSIALNSISKFKTRVLPSILEFIDRKKQLPKNLLFSFAALIRFYKGDFHGEKLPVQDSPEVISFFNEVWKQADLSNITKQALANENLWGLNLNEITGITETTAQYLKQIDEGRWKQLDLH